MESAPRAYRLKAGNAASPISTFAGAIPLETIDGFIIEAHLRFADQWPDLYGNGRIDALVRLYEKGDWQFADHDRHDGYSVVLFGPNGRSYLHPPQTLIDEINRMDGVTSVQITFHEDWVPGRHAMPPGGFRLAIVNCCDLTRGQKARERFEEFFLRDAPDPGSA